MRRCTTADSARHRREHYAQAGEGHVNSPVTCEVLRPTVHRSDVETLYRMMKIRKTLTLQGFDGV
ncbi:hypothetical protein SMG44B_30273 [Stenotrophomonas maltophilia]